MTLLLCSLPRIVGAETPLPRDATIDTAGAKAEVQELSHKFPGAKPFFADDNSVHITTDNFTLAIPLNRLISITASDKRAEVVYVSSGVERKITGKLSDGILSGKVKSENFEVRVSKLQKLTFSENPRVENEAPEPADGNTANVTFSNGDRITIDSIKRHDFTIGEGIYVGETFAASSGFTDIRISDGGKLATFEFSAIQKIEFGPNNDIAVTLRTGERRYGKASQETNARVIGWFGDYNGGRVYVPSVNVMEFSESHAPKSK